LRRNGIAAKSVDFSIKAVYFITTIVLYANKSGNELYLENYINTRDKGPQGIS
jgi:hypothetical protein